MLSNRRSAARTPIVAKNESKREISCTAYGDIMKTSETEIIKFVKESLVFESRNRRLEIRSIPPARKTETENPVIPI